VAQETNVNAELFNRWRSNGRPANNNQTAGQQIYGSQPINKCRKQQRININEPRNLANENRNHNAKDDLCTMKTQRNNRGSVNGVFQQTRFNINLAGHQQGTSAGQHQRCTIECRTDINVNNRVTAWQSQRGINKIATRITFVTTQLNEITAFNKP
jgi:hypothetical protein